MKKKKVLSLLLAAGMLIASLTGCGSSNSDDGAAQESVAEETTATEEETTVTEEAAVGEDAARETDQIGEAFAETVQISMMNSKPEITDALEEAAAIFGEQYNVEIEIYETDSPGDVLAQKYAAGDAPTLAIIDRANVRDYAEKLADLSNESWCEVGGSTMGASVDGVIYGMPLTVEGMCILYNKTAVEETLGREFVAADYTSLDAFKGLLEELSAAGMETPVVLNSEDWSIGQKGYQWIYDYYDGTEEGAISFLTDIHEGNTTFIESEIFNKVYDAFDLFIEYNINRDDPLAADYDLNASYVAEGEAAFWVNGTWAWPDFEPYAVEGSEYGILPFPINDSVAAGKVVADPTKYVTVDAVNASEDQQKAAKMFLNWLVFSDEGQDVLINKCGIITAFTNINLEPANPFNVSLKEYIDAGMTIPGANYMPSDHRSVLAANMQAYLDGKMTREEVAEKLNDYWTTNLPVQ